MCHPYARRTQVRVDSSGAALHLRTWHLAAGKAPMRQSVAAAMLAAVGWPDLCAGGDPRAVSFVSSAEADRLGAVPQSSERCGVALVDPFCGSGAIPIEAALLGIGQPPHGLVRDTSDVTCEGDPDGMARAFALPRWPSFERGAWASVHGEAEERAHAAAVRREQFLPARIVAADRSSAAVAATRANARRAGVDELIEFRHADVSELRRPSSLADTPVQRGVGPPGVVLCNPPWGVRVAAASGELPNLYSQLGRVVSARLPGWGLGVLVADRALVQQALGQSRLPLQTALLLRSGDVRTWLMTTAVATAKQETERGLEPAAAPSSVGIATRTRTTETAQQEANRRSRKLPKRCSSEHTRDAHDSAPTLPPTTEQD